MNISVSTIANKVILCWALLTLSQVGFSNSFYSSTSKAEHNQLRIETAQQLIAEDFAMSLLAGDPADGVKFLDLRGTACYPQPDQLVSCGSPDTLSILLYTKSVNPIGPIDVNLELGEGLRYGGFVNIGTPDGNMASSLDVISTTNLESPIFRLSELSQANGGVVLEIAVQALCGVDFAANPPDIGLNLFYEGCVDNHDLDPLSAEPITPEVVFTGAPGTVTITDVETNFCMAQDFTQVTLDAAAGEVTVTMSDYGFPEITLDEIMLGGMVVDPAFITMDPVTGFTEVVLDGNAISSYFGGDGLLDQNEIETIEFCFQIQECPSAEIELPITPLMTILTTCNGEVCGSGADIEDMGSINISPNFGATAVSTFESIQLPEACSADGSAKQYIFDIEMTSSLADPLRGRLDNLRFFVDECAGGALALDAIEMYTGGTSAGALLPVDLGSASFNINADGRLTISFRGAITDPDGPGGLDDLDGDLAFDDLVGGDSVRFRVYMSPASCAGECIADDDDEPDSCQFFRVQTQGIKDCSKTFTATDVIDPPDPALISESYALFGELEDLNNSGSIQGYDFGTVGTNSAGPITGTIDGQFIYNISDADFNQCPTPGTPKLRVVYIGDEATAENIWLDNASLDGTPIAAGDITVSNSPGSAVFYIDAGDVAPGEHIFDFDMSIDTSYCGTAATYLLNTQLVEECPSCDCSPFIRACQVTLVRVDPDDSPNCYCDYDGIASSERINYGYTDRTKATPLTKADFPGDDHPELDNVLPGDYLELKGQYILTNAASANGRTERLNFNLLALQGGSVNLPNLEGRLNVDASSLQSFQVKRGTTVFDALDIPVTGSIGGTYDGITLNGTRAASVNSRNENTIQPGLPAGGYSHSVKNSSNDYTDGNSLIVYFWGSDRVAPGAFNALQGLYDLIGGGFEDMDTVEIVWHVPVILTPDVLVDGMATTGPLLTDNFITRATMDARDFIPGTTTLSGNFIGGGAVFNGNNGATACLFQDTITIFDPGVAMNSEIIYDEFGCTAEICHNLTIENPVPADWYQSPVEYRPSIGLEQLFTEWPTPYIYSGGSTYELLKDGVGVVSTEPDSIFGTEQIGNAHCVADRYGEMLWLDAETKDGLRDIKYNDFDYANDDWSLSGGTFPLLGVGAETLMDPDTLKFTIPLTRLCTDEAPETPIEGSFEASYEYLADYAHNTYLCNDARWYTGVSGDCDPTGFYWPWTRDHDSNPHRFTGASTLVETGAPVPPVNVSIAFTNPLLVDGGGGETNTMTICPEAPTTMIPGGVVIVEMPSNVTLDASTPALTFIMNSASGGKIYSADILDGTAAGSCYEFELETTLLFCGPDQICASTVPCPADIELVLAKELECVEKGCYRYRAGAPEMQAGFENPVAPAPCVVQDYEINFNNTGTSGLTELCAVIYLPPGLEPMPAGTFDVTLETATGPTTVAIPYAEETGLTGVYGTALKLDDAAMETLLGPDGLEPTESVAVNFSAEATCDFVSGSSPGLLVTAEADCDPFEFHDAGQAIHTVDPAGGADFTLEVEPLLISCEENGANIRITAINVGKSVTADATICLTLPPELTLAEADIVPAAPDGYAVENYSAEPVGTAGAMMISFDAPDTEVGDYFCLDIGLALQGDAPCGPIDIGFAIKESQEVVCPSQTEPCDMQSLASEGLITLEVVPNGAAGEATLVAECGTGVVDVTWSLELLGLNGDPMSVDIEFFQDIDGNGMVDAYDIPVGTAAGVAYTFAAPGETDTQTGVLSIDAEMACPLIAKVDFPTDCACSKLEVQFPEVIPAALAELGESVALCPGEPLVLDACDGLTLEASPAAAATVTETAGSIEVAITPGFGVTSPVQLIASYDIGGCSQEFIIDITQLEEFEFPDQAIHICTDGIQQIDLGVPISMSEDIVIDITPATYLDDPTSQEPFINSPAADITYMVSYTLDNGSSSCTTTAEIVVTVSDPPAIVDLEAMFDCDTKMITLSEVGEIEPMGLDGVWSSLGTGTFDGGTQFSTATTYTPSQADLDAYNVDLVLVTEAVVEIVNGVPQIVCGPVRDTLSVELICCESFTDSELDLCEYITENPTSPLATLDCDGGGVDNITECFGPDYVVNDDGTITPTVGYTPTDPSGGNPEDDCDVFVDNGPALCDLIAADPTNPLATLDCDGGGVDNITECFGPDYVINDDGTITPTPGYVAKDPSGGNPEDDCDVFEDDGPALCDYIAANPTSPLATLDCDGGGVDNITECFGPDYVINDDGTITATPGYTATDPSGGNPEDDCDVFVDDGPALCDLIASDPTNPLATLDCDGGGVDNITECFGPDYVINDDGTITPTEGYTATDPSGGNPEDDCDVFVDDGPALCELIASDPTNPLATLDCDGGGVDNITECFGPDYVINDDGTLTATAGYTATDPSGGNPEDDCDVFVNDGPALCELLASDPTNPLALLDCDGGGVDNLTECFGPDGPIEDPDNPGTFIPADPDFVPTDPSNENDDWTCDNYEESGMTICELIAANPDATIGAEDCDGGGIDNATECDLGLDPTDDSDDCPDNLACTPVNLSLDENCEVIITGNMMVTGGTFPNEAFVVTITDEHGNVLENPIGEEYLGQTLNVSVSMPNCPDVAPCWNTAMIEDKLLPSLDLDDCTVSCNALYLPDGTPEIPMIDADNCGGAEVIWLGDVPDPDFDCEDPDYDGFSGVFIRSFAVVDAAMNTDGTVYTKEVWVERPDLTDVTFPPAIDIDCSESTDPENTGFPTLAGNPLYPNVPSELCNVFLTYTDSAPIPSLCSNYTIMRTWRLVEWYCGFEYTAPTTFPQVINVTDMTGPTLSELPDVTISTVHDCSVDYALPIITATDDCNAVDSYLINTGVNPVYSNNGETVTFTHDANNVDGTVYTIEYVVTDDCHNSSTESFDLTVIDDKGPIAICEFATTVNLADDGFTHVYAEFLDDGSFDGCGYVKLDVRRMTDNCDKPENLEFGEKVAFCCADKGTEQMVVLRVTDGAGNENICMVTVYIENKDETMFTIPDDQVLTSDECAALDLTNIQAFGPVTVEDECFDCDDLSCVTVEDSESVFECDTEVYTRTYTLTRPNADPIVLSHTVTCQGAGYDFDNLVCPASTISITDPAAGGCLGDISPEALNSMPIINAGPLDQIAVNFTDEVYNPVIVDGETFYKKVVRTWTILDWCATGGDEIVSETCVQTIKLENAPFDACVTDLELDLDASCQVTIPAPFTVNPGCVVFTIDGGADNFLQSGTSVTLPITEGPHTILWTATNLFGEADQSCSMAINVSDPLDICPMMLTQNRIQGNIHTEMSLDVKDVEVRLMGTNDMVMTDADGNYDFGYMTAGGAYEVEPFSNFEHRNGVSTLDIIIIQRHLLNLQSLTSPYQYIAADANKSGDLTASDIVNIRKLVLEIHDEFPSNTSWRFVDEQQVFIDPNNPFVQGLDETYQIGQLINDMTINFVGVKIGDVNNSVTMSLGGNVTEQRGAPISIGYSRGSGSLDLTANEAMDLSGLQLELVFDQEVSDMTSVLPGFEDDNYVISGNTVKISYAAKAMQRITKGQSLFEVTTESKSVAIGESTLQSEVYTGDSSIEVHSVQLENKNMGLYAPKMVNQPNPWSESTDIIIVTPIAQDVDIVFTNDLGQIIYTYSDYAHVGINRFTLSRELLNTSGVVYYTALVGNETLKGTMLIIE